jgi:hypothetical protein
VSQYLADDDLILDTGNHPGFTGTIVHTETSFLATSMAVVGTSETIALHKEMAAMEVNVIRSQLHSIAFERGSISAA